MVQCEAVFEAPCVVQIPLLQAFGPEIGNPVHFGVRLRLARGSREFEAPTPSALVRDDSEAAAIEMREPLLFKAAGLESAARFRERAVAVPFVLGADLFPVDDVEAMGWGQAVGIGRLRKERHLREQGKGGEGQDGCCTEEPHME